jgi:HEAT repeat protein
MTNALDAWARDCAGYSDWDTFIRLGGASAEARADLRRRISSLRRALDDLAEPLDERHTIVRPPIIDPDMLEKLETEDEPADTANAHPEGAEQDA